MSRYGRTQMQKSLEAQMRVLGASSYTLQKPEIPVLAGLMDHDEILQAYAFGFYEAGYAMLASTNKRLLFIDKMIIGLKVEDIPFGTLNAVEYDLGFFFGKVRVSSRGGEFYFRWVKKRDAQNFYAVVDQKILKVQGRGQRG